MTGSSVEQRLTVLEEDVATLKRNTVTRGDIQQLLSYMGRIDSNITQLNDRVGRIDTNVVQINNRVNRLEETIAVVPDLSRKVDAIGNDIKRLIQEL